MFRLTLEGAGVTLRRMLSVEDVQNLLTGVLAARERIGGEEMEERVLMDLLTGTKPKEPRTAHVLPDRPLVGRDPGDETD